jgi:hypothetical protein
MDAEFFSPQSTRGRRFRNASAVFRFFLSFFFFFSYRRCLVGVEGETVLRSGVH